MAVNDMAEQLKSLQAALGSVHKTAHSTGDEMQNLAKSLLGFGRLAGAQLAARGAETLYNYVVKHVREMKTVLVQKGEELDKQKQSLENAKTLLKTYKQMAVIDPVRIADQEELVQQYEEGVGLLQKDYDWHVKLKSIVARPYNLGVLLVSQQILQAVAATFDRSVRFNQSLTQANTDLRVRHGLMYQMLTIQSQLGNSTESMAESAEALVGYGHDLHTGFQQNVKVVAMMRDGLRVSAHTGAELVTIFTRQLREGAERVGDVIAQIARDTALSAQKAAEFAIEVGRALRLLGPGFRSDAAGVTKVVTELAGRVQELGGNAGSVVQMFKAMSGGTAQSFFMRGIAGVRPGYLGSAQGAEDAMRGIDRWLGRMVSAAPGTEMYLAQLEAAAEITGMAAVDIVDFREAMQSMNQPLEQSQALQKAYREQMTALGESMRQAKDALMAVVVQGAMPVVRIMTMVARGFADATKLIASWKPFVYIVQVTMPVAAITATIALGKLIAQIGRLALTSQFTSNLLATTGLGPVLSKVMPLLGKFAKGGLAPLAIGYGVGTVIDQAVQTYFPSINKGIQDLIKEVMGWHREDRDDKNTIRAIRRSGSSAVSDVRKVGREIAQAALDLKDPWDMTAGLAAIEAQMAQRFPGLKAGAVKATALDEAHRYIAGAIQAATMTRSTTKTEEDKKEDERLRLALETLEILKRQLDYQESLKRASDSQTDLMRQSTEATVQQQKDSIWQKVFAPENSNRPSYWTPGSISPFYR